MKPSKVHAMDENCRRYFASGLTPFRDPVEPDITDELREVGQPFPVCAYCDSIPAATLAQLLKEGKITQIEVADRKYGWPHKVYGEVVNPQEGMLEIRGGTYSGGALAKHDPVPASQYTHIKFYTLHLQDATDEEAGVIERALGLHFVFGVDGTVQVTPLLTPLAKACVDLFKEMPQYRCHKTVRALKIKEVVFSAEGHAWTLVFEGNRFDPHPVPLEYMQKHDPQAGGYFVVYEDGYTSFSPAKPFEEGYVLVSPVL